ncbi:hypothetical protein PybrP1_001656 [[Pythium] brassicae (nom. inval.)]|nr:hypothetical protein PybrP1_001656 [[Pythium] brassicae (nom. inval.)]
MATTQLSEAYALQKTKSGAVSSPDISEGKKYVNIIDQNSGSYTYGYSEIDTSNQFVGSQGWANLGDAYITVLVAITAKILGALPNTPKQSAVSSSCLKLTLPIGWTRSQLSSMDKRSSAKVTICGIMPISKLFVRQKHSYERFLSGSVDDWTSLGYSGTAGAFGDGYYNARTNHKSATDQTDFRSAPNSICNSAAFQRSIQSCPMVVNKASEPNSSPFNWPSLGKGSGTKEILRSNAKGA